MDIEQCVLEPVNLPLYGYVQFPTFTCGIRIWSIRYIIFTNDIEIMDFALHVADCLQSCASCSH